MGRVVARNPGNATLRYTCFRPKRVPVSGPPNRTTNWSKNEARVWNSIAVRLELGGFESRESVTSAFGASTRSARARLPHFLAGFLVRPSPRVPASAYWKVLYHPRGAGNPLWRALWSPFGSPGGQFRHPSRAQEHHFSVNGDPLIQFLPTGTPKFGTTSLIFFS